VDDRECAKGREQERARGTYVPSAFSVSTRQMQPDRGRALLVLFGAARIEHMTARGERGRSWNSDVRHECPPKLGKSYPFLLVHGEHPCTPNSYGGKPSTGGSQSVPIQNRKQKIRKHLDSGKRNN
jgi:hypothetical protein